MSEFSSEHVIFCFEGSQDGSMTVEVSIPREHLAVLPESYLTVFADRWASSSKTEEYYNRKEALRVYPWKDYVKDFWNSMSMGQLIVAAYKYHFKIDRIRQGFKFSPSRPFKLQIPADVELVDALGVLEYYGLYVDDPENEIRVPNVNKDLKLRALLLLEHRNLITSVKKYILSSFEKKPRRVRFFVNRKSDDDLNFISENNGGYEFDQLGTALYIDNLEWLEEGTLRDYLVNALEAEGLDATFEVLARDEIYNDRHGEEWQEYHLEHETIMLAVGEIPRSPRGRYNDRFRMERRHVLRVEIPRAPKKPRFTK